MRTCLEGIGHGLRRSMTSLGVLLGSLWGSSGLQLNSTLFLYGGPILPLMIAIVSQKQPLMTTDTTLNYGCMCLL